MKITKIYTRWTTLGGSLNEPMMFVSDRDYVSDGDFGLQEHDVDIDVTEPSKAEAVDAIVKELRAEQLQLRAKVAQIDDRIQSLLCLEHKEVA